MQDSDNSLTEDALPGLIRRIALPSSIGFFFHTMYNVVDTFYGGLVSTEALAALSIGFPVFFLIIAFSSGISTGTAALIANALGAGDKAAARTYAAQSITFSIMVSVLVTAFGLVCAPALFRFMGAEGAYLETALAYMNVIFAGAFTFMITNTLNASLTAQGDTASFRNVLIAGFFLNLALNPWFMFGGLGVPAMGFKGIAVATILIEGLSGFYIGYKAWKTGILNAQSFALLRPRWRTTAELSGQGFPASLNMMTVGIGIFVITYFVSHFGKSAVAAYGIATRIEQIAILPAIGLNMSSLAIAGQSFGAGHYARIKECLRLSLRYSWWVCMASGPVVFVFAGPLMRIFTADAEVVRVGVQYLQIAVFTFFAYGIIFITTSTLQGMKKPMIAVWIGLYRQILAPVIFYPLLAHTCGLGLYGLWFGIFIVCWSGAIMTYGFGRSIIGKYV